MIFLIDHNIEGQSLMLFGSITSEGWLETLPIRFISFDEVELPITSSDRVVWRFAQENQMILLTANRSMKGEDSLEQVIREECLPTSLPVVTFANVARIIEREYREECVDRLIEIALYLENYLGVSRLFIP
ncbi:MAG: ACP S-malonyltransferase [Microcystis aeruginosa W13-18]|uniref:ACP S-malonyltransferase n=1 Tax=Microcystis viridis Mv_BB_P_19951000_S68D TaxID=2486270 RepID=A0A552I189_MICVR|nr:ACP S-malonyltransferase [Microcystis aeruginosa W13-18]NCR10143.1 ACP S-malonyltransferase [Microcystis aeruginosa LG13-11]NCR37169.1 ACP S-malonyltransferase [Microcystis aeruginosa S11-05]NCR50707.1 ACP S-malonyltransferase [Microcystis aeruginosa S11-01]NCS49834.1 ACP S-malonyltransferase [Microcystis aeruginosa BK11-02]NCS78867.1 ACP S-malonyltransferase [Microcystis aeruginosa K13-07]TRU77241.1 MAG: ACP S-malonyltransferase [Microcystis viridis Mv_BB_P_19951000_S68D]TRU82224.1 MAG: 